MVKEEQKATPEEPGAGTEQQALTPEENGASPPEKVSEEKATSGDSADADDKCDNNDNDDKPLETGAEASSAPECDSAMEQYEASADAAASGDHASQPAKDTDPPQEDARQSMKTSQSTHSVASSTNSHLPDADWSITFEQFLASILTEGPLVDFFEKQNNILPVIDRYRNRRILERSESISGSPPNYVS